MFASVQDRKRATSRESLRELANSLSGKNSTPFGVEGSVFVMAEAERIREQYAKQRRLPLYQQLVQTAKIIGTWDDHDYGMSESATA
jgi:hypothetical protein